MHNLIRATREEGTYHTGSFLGSRVVEVLRLAVQVGEDEPSVRMARLALERDRSFAALDHDWSRAGLQVGSQDSRHPVETFELEDGGCVGVDALLDRDGGDDRGLGGLGREWEETAK